LLAVDTADIHKTLRSFFFFSLWLCNPLDLGRFFSSLILHTVGRTLLAWDQTVARPVPTHRITQIQDKRTQAFMPRLEYEPTIPVFELENMVHALDLALRSYLVHYISEMQCMRNKIYRNFSSLFRKQY
jgi:hypothetical protein